MKRSILITGGAGFIGSNFINYLSPQGDDQIVNLDKLTYAANIDNIYSKNDENYHFIEGDICDTVLLSEVFEKYKIDTVIHFAAESHVDNSISSPKVFVDTNVIGTFNLLQEAYNFWMNAPNKFKVGFEGSRFIHISTDEVYGTLGDTNLFTEKTPYAPNSPYSASKASSDFLVRSYFHTYGLPVITTNCSNNYGPHQHDEKLIPTIIRKALDNQPIPIYGDGTNIRDWLYVVDHCKGIYLALEKGKLGETYNIGGRNERQNTYIAEKICEILDNKVPLSNSKSYKKLITYVPDRPGHDFRYAIDASKIENELGWNAKENFESGIEKTIEWYIDKYKNRKQ